jgi:heme/copper-type cytochrome/quinol oxidase subunit 2
MLSIAVLFLCGSIISNGFESNLMQHSKARSSLSMQNSNNLLPKTDRGIQLSSVWSVASLLSAVVIAVPSAALAQQGSIKSSTLAETKAAVGQLKVCLDGLNTMSEAAAKQEWQVIRNMLTYWLLSTIFIKVFYDAQQLK